MTVTNSFECEYGVEVDANDSLGMLQQEIVILYNNKNDSQNQQSDEDHLLYLEAVADSALLHFHQLNLESILKMYHVIDRWLPLESTKNQSAIVFNFRARRLLLSSAQSNRLNYYSEVIEQQFWLSKNKPISVKELIKQKDLIEDDTEENSMLPNLQLHPLYFAFNFITKFLFLNRS